MSEIIVNTESTGERLDAYIADNVPNLSRTAVKRLIEDGNVQINRRVIEKASYRVQEGDVVNVVVPDAKELDLKAEDIPIEVVYEDSDIIVVNKPKGLVVHPANGNWWRNKTWNCAQVR